MRFQVRRVGGAQAVGALQIGLVKIAESSARDLFDMGIPLVLAPSKASPAHFFAGWSLAMPINSQHYLEEEGRRSRFVVPRGSGPVRAQPTQIPAFEKLRNRFNANTDGLGEAAWFVEQKYVAETTAAKSQRARRGWR